MWKRQAYVRLDTDMGREGEVDDTDVPHDKVRDRDWSEIIGAMPDSSKTYIPSRSVPGTSAGPKPYPEPGLVSTEEIDEGEALERSGTGEGEAILVTNTSGFCFCALPKVPVLRFEWERYSRISESLSCAVRSDILCETIDVIAFDFTYHKERKK
jgi:hypothetical protein